MLELQRLHSTADINSLFPAEFFASPDPSSFEVDVAGYEEPISPVIELAEADSVLAEAASRFQRGETAMDGWLTVRLHRALPLSREVAADSRLWAWLGLVRHPDTVARRWWRPASPNLDETGQPKTAAGTSMERFAGSRVRHAFARLWWAAELTVDGDDYRLTEKLLAMRGFQDAYEGFFGREFIHYRPALEAAIEVLESREEKVVRETCKELNLIFSTVVLESCSRDELINITEEVAASVERRIG